jgi:hypothetical protein
MVVRGLIAILGACAVVLVLPGCGSSMAPPAERLASSEANLRTANELGAQQNPRAALHAKLAEEEIDKARAFMKDGDNQHADAVLQRATADAELALALAREASTRAEAEQAADQIRALRKGP